jgi:hypothetical protein
MECEYFVPNANNYDFSIIRAHIRMLIHLLSSPVTRCQRLDSDECLLYSQPLIIMFL